MFINTQSNTFRQSCPESEMPLANTYLAIPQNGSSQLLFCITGHYGASFTQRGASMCTTQPTHPPHPQGSGLWSRGWTSASLVQSGCSPELARLHPCHCPRDTSSLRNRNRETNKTGWVASHTGCLPHPFVSPSQHTLSHQRGCWGGRNFPLPYKVFLTGLRIKLTCDSLTGENQTKV